MARQDPQINVRLSDEENELLEAAGWVKRSGRTELAKAAVQEAIARYRKEEAVQQALAARRAADHEAESKITPIGSKAVNPGLPTKGA